MEEGKLADGGEEFHLVPFFGSKGGIGLGGKEPFVKEEFESKARRKDVGIGGELFEVKTGECKEIGTMLVGELRPDEILRNRSRSCESIVTLSEFKEGIDECRVLKGGDVSV